MYPRFFRFLDFLHFISYMFYEIIILSCDLTTSERKKNFEETLYLQPHRFMSLHLHLLFDFSDARLLGHSSYFDKLFLVIIQA